ncbi:hypothetical protein BFP71_14070 [Roseivirga misakiensis]|uniref:ABC transporter permease n=2 Tax=Roseivirga misakiensis TaxID=1563681 RepID=A0A1E5T2H2_9BACT|nr:hypothetical protein BFP71_14070 [Roseivirga misakiensis]
MLKNYLKIAFRNFVKHKFYSFVNVFGLTAGLSIVLLIGLFVNDELSFDEFHEHKNELYRVVENQYYAGEPVFPVAVTPYALGPSLKTDYPEVEKFTRIVFEDFIFEQDGREIIEYDGIRVDEDFFDMFSFEVLTGSVKDFKANLNTLILTETLAKKYFTDQNPIGKGLKLDGEEFIVSAVIADVPKNSHLDFYYIVNIEKIISEDPERGSNWDSNTLYTYVQLGEGTNLEHINDKVIGHIKKNNEGSVVDIYLQPLTDIYLGTVDFVVEVQRKGTLLYVQTFSVVAIFILIISCINFMNLSTAKSEKRAKEVGLRKTIGARKEQLIFQFLSESVLLSIIAVMLSIGVVALLLPTFNALTNKEFDLVAIAQDGSVGLILLGIFGVAFFTGIVSGSYPALFLSSIKPILTLNTQSISVKQGAGFRKVLVVFQFAISVILIIGTLTVYKQLSFIQGADLGYDRDNTMYLPVDPAKAQLFADEVRNQPGIVGVGVSNRHPNRVYSSSAGFNWPGKNQDETVLIHFMGMDHNYVKTMDMTILEGRDFLYTDTAAVLINEKAKALMGMDDPVGKTMSAYGDRRIVGVIKDFNFKSIHTEIEPLVILHRKDLGLALIKYEDAYAGDVIKTVEKKWGEVFPSKSFNYGFLEQDFSELYVAEERTKKLSTYFAVLAIIISCMGLFGLVSYAVEQRKKEVGIRKVLGASVAKLFLLMTNDFAKLVLISLAVSIPVGRYAMSLWLEGFAYRIELSAETYILSGLIALAITILTVSYQSIRAATNNPVTTLRNE